MKFGADWLGGFGKIAQQGFQIYNMVKKFIPGGSKAGAGNVPGGPNPGATSLTELFGEDILDGSGLSLDDGKKAVDAFNSAKNGEWGDVKETAFGVGKNILDSINKNSDAQKDNLNERKKLWRAAL